MSKLVLAMGDHCVSDFIKNDSEGLGRKKYSLDLYQDDQYGAVRLHGVAPADTMWGQYWYRSGINASMTKELQGIVAEVTSRVNTKSGDIWLDIACNDGTLLKSVPDNMIKLGIDPADDSFRNESTRVAHEVVQDYFSLDAWQKTGYGHAKAKVITCIAMFYDLDDPVPFIQDLYRVLDDNGTLVLQMSYTPLMVKQLAFDNICHEHVYYYDLKSITRLFAENGFVVVDCGLNDTNGGSFRVYLQKDVAEVSSFATAPLRDVCNFRVNSILAYERVENDITDPETWKLFGDRLAVLKEQVVSFVHQAVKQGKTVYGYGASTKGNTLLQYFGLDHNYITAIAERSPYKFGMKTIGTNIPIISEEEMRVAKPDYMLVLPWHFINEFERREQDYLKSGGTFIVPCPAFRLVTG